MNEIKKIIFPIHQDQRGSLVVVEGSKDVPFPIARLFYIYGGGNEVRGCHANRKSEFVMVNVSGSCKLKVHDGQNEHIFMLDTPNEGIYLPKMTWKEMYDFSDDSVLLCIASTPYLPEEYIRDKEKFLKDAQIAKAK